MEQNQHLGPGSPPLDGPAKEQTSPTHSAAPRRHPRRCLICRHPEREAIDERFLDWSSPYDIGREYSLSPRSLYRHFSATGLIWKRRESLRIVLDRILERGAQTPITGDMIIRAVRAQCCLTDDNKWIEPARHMVIEKRESLIDTSAVRK